jgi:hypothetical protein
MNVGDRHCEDPGQERDVGQHPGLTLPESPAVWRKISQHVRRKPLSWIKCLKIKTGMIKAIATMPDII